MWESLGSSNNEIEIVPYRQEWARIFIRESERLYQACANLDVKIEHIGSTSVPGLAAKPILDMMLGFPLSLKKVTLSEQITRLGYEYLGEYGIPGRCFFVLKHQNCAVVHVHGFPINSHDWQRHLFFRNHLRTHRSQKIDYENLKKILAARFKHDRKAYSQAKAAFINAIELNLQE